jgi:hypothetical protein
MVDKLRPMLKDAGFSEVEDIPTPHKNFAFIRCWVGQNQSRQKWRDWLTLFGLADIASVRTWLAWGRSRSP